MPTIPSPGVLVRRGGGRDKFFLQFSFPGHANRREGIVKALQRTDSLGGQDVNKVGDTVVFFGQEDYRDPDFFEAAGSNPTRMRVSKTGLYRCHYELVAGVTAATAAVVRTRVEKNRSGTAIPGAESILFIPGTSNARAHADATFLVSLSAWDYLELITVRVTSTGGTSTLASASSFMMECLSYTGESLLGTRQLVERTGVIEKCTITKGVSGFSGTTYVDVLKNGTSMLGSTKLQIASSVNYKEFGAYDFQTRNVDVGDSITIDVISEEAPYPRDLFVSIKCGASS